MLQTWQASQNKSKTLASKANKTMNSSFQDHYFQPHPPPTSAQPDHPTTHHAKEEVDVIMASASKKKGGVRLSTDPQSVAARERRHRISHRLKTLQSLVPGAAKLDTVSLLDHAIHYVHFLNSQIRFHQLLLLSNGHYHYDYDFSEVANYDPRYLQVVRHDQCLGFVGPPTAPAPAALPPPEPVEEEGCVWVGFQGRGVPSG